MLIFAPFRRRSAKSDQGPGRELPDAVRHALPPHFEAVGEALASDADMVAACSVVGRDVARDGAGLGEALEGLRATYGLVKGVEPAYRAVEALSVAWSEATLEYLHQLSCEDPLTGLASLAHVRTRLAEMYREAEQSGRCVRAAFALVVVEVCPEAPSRPGHPFTRALQMVQVAEALRLVWPGGETIGRLGSERATVVVPRHPDLGAAVALLRALLADLDLGASRVRVWIEGLPDATDSATRLLDDLTR